MSRAWTELFVSDAYTVVAVTNLQAAGVSGLDESHRWTPKRRKGNPWVLPGWSDVEIVGAYDETKDGTFARDLTKRQDILRATVGRMCLEIVAVSGLGFSACRNPTDYWRFRYSYLHWLGTKPMN